ncbi:MAG: phosphoribosylformylglycinamidine synthase subunit PurQ [Bdellovibrionales bacterium]|nr:phosphoribosylformylglycinamidine synthase subunit PurQ [Bdellovibrionales bacterium]
MSDVKRPRVLVLRGPGILSENETAQAFATAGFEVHLRNLADLVAEGYREERLSEEYAVLAIPGGASTADELGSGKLLALKIQHLLGWTLTGYAARGGMVIGIGSGFHTLIRLGVFGREISVTSNGGTASPAGAGGRSLQGWVKVAPIGMTCTWLRGLGVVDLPLRHPEARIVIHPNRKTETLVKLQRRGLHCLKYEGNPIGSDENIAGLCDLSGRILGIMPHPESFIRWTAHPEWTTAPQRANAPGQGLAIFENAYQEFMRAIQPPA